MEQCHGGPPVRNCEMVCTFKMQVQLVSATKTVRCWEYFYVNILRLGHMNKKDTSGMKSLSL